MSSWGNTYTIKSSSKTLIFLILIIYIYFILPQLGNLFVADETVFVKAAKSVSSGGGPLYEDKGREVTYALWHPALYINILALSFKLFGVNEVSARVVSVVFVLGALFLIIKMYRNNPVLLASLFILNPFVIQNSLLLDIDNSILTFLIVLFIYSYLKIDSDRYSHLLIMGLLFGIMLWSKFATSLVPIASILLFHSINGNIKKGIKNSAVVFAIGATFFALTWWAYTAFLNLSFWAPILRNLGHLSVSKGFILTVYTRLWSLRNLVFWATPFFIILGFLALRYRVKTYLITRKLEQIDFMALNALLILLLYGLVVDSRISQDFPKYFAPMMPIFAILITDYVGTFSKNEIKHFVSIGTVFLLYYFFVAGDPLLSEQVLFTSGSTNDILIPVLKTFVLYILPFFIGTMLIRGFSSAGWERSMAISSVIALLTFSIHIGYVQSHAEYSTIFGYGEMGSKNVISYLNTNAKPTDIILSREDIAYYSNVYTYYDVPENLGELMKLSGKVEISYIIIPQRGPFSRVNPGLIEYIESEYYPVEGDFGSFRVYQRKVWS